MYNFGSFDALIVKPTILPEICSTIITGSTYQIELYLALVIENLINNE